MTSNNFQAGLSRRSFLSGLAASAAFLTTGIVESSAASQKNTSIVLFSKVYQELNLNFDDAADLTREAGLQGLDVPLRPGGEVLPERASEDLPRYAEALKKRGLRLPLLT